jgi:thiamine-phosphate pyrophosphorylase
VKDARLYLVSPAELAAGGLADLVPELAFAGVDVIQLREKEMEAADVIRVGVPIRTACAAAGIPFIVNDRPDVALALQADGVHLGQKDVPTEIARAILGDSAIVGHSTHASGEIDRAVSQKGIDYIAVGPVFATPTKEGREPVGRDLVRYAAEQFDGVWFAIGGITAETLPEVMGAGARRIVVVRAITEADDPPAAAARLRTMLDAG